MLKTAAINITCLDIIYSGVPKIPASGEETYSTGFKMCLGGGSPATMITLMRLGMDTRIGTFLGRDWLSDFIKKEYKEAGAEPTNFYHDDKMPLTVSTVISTAKNRTFLSYQEVRDIKTDEETAYEFLKNSKAVYMNACYPLTNKRLREDGTLLFYDTGWDDTTSAEQIKQNMKLADYFTPNLSEAVKLTGEKNPVTALKALGKYIKNPIIKLDKEGCLVMENSNIFLVPEIKEFICKDSTGAGDSFMAGLMYGVLNGYEIKECVLLGNITGGKAVTGVGCLTEFVEEKELLKIFKQNKAAIKSVQMS